MKDLVLADYDHDSSQFHVGVLIGLDHYHSFFTGHVIKTNGGPVANETILGWVLSGPISSTEKSSHTNFCTTSHVRRCSFEACPASTDDTLRKDLDKFWAVENVAGSDQCVIHQFEKEIAFNGERYVTKLPFRPDHRELSDNLEICKSRLRNLKSRLERDSMTEKYDAIFKDYETDKIIEKVPDHEVEKDLIHYLPHCGVVREDKETTKLRVVFDASCSNRSSPSLNDCLYPGPNLLCKIFDILLRFRLNPIAILSDIKQILARSLPMTKRNVVKVGATFFDPLGFISPITTRVKAIFQLLCKDKSDWDEKISGDVLSVWEKFLVDLKNFTDLRIKRFAFVEVTANIQSVTLHGFCDSSFQSYCGVLYLQIFTSIGIRVYFLAAKTKVAPLKELSIARLELLGCVLLIHLIDQVKCAINGRVMLTDVKCWSDSEVALYWIKGRGKRWKPWVENRVVKIRKVVDDENWSYVEGKNNPADVPTRICVKGDFQKWFEGPVFLYTGDRVGFFDVERRISDCDVLLESSKTSRKIANNPQVLSITAEVDSETSNNYVSSKQNVNISCVVI